ncbi:winged helix-turn-helix transcriptional regulator [Paraburkholderia caledonica]|uniref:DNA-binding HxlR family transcriptional regulator n=1 Tax=Paraburkholderia caledonica TaxID=134536 RepID=A0AB73INV2_9BURK|nr:helix-turn-helix domain-containing protein [Paraburkholderia caledonica]MDP9651042.1 DNA-binding HxlR family transcriptional regulator [Paraburkholderia caledonica]
MESKTTNAPLSRCDSPQQLEAAIRALSGRWKPVILFHLFSAGRLRFSELHRLAEGVTHKVLTQQLRELERDGVVARAVFAEVPPRVEYRLTNAGYALLPALRALNAWGAASLGESTDA